MFRLLSAGAAVIGIALCIVIGLAVEYPWAFGAVCAVCYAVGRYTERRADPQRIVDVELLSPAGYETHCATLLREAGWAVRVCGGGTGDQGVDVVADLGGVRAVIQCKRHIGRVGNRAVQEIAAGRAHYRAQVAVVAAPFGYTRAAEQLANSNSVLLLNHADLTALAGRIANRPTTKVNR